MAFGTVASQRASDPDVVLGAARASSPGFAAAMAALMADASVEKKGGELAVGGQLRGSGGSAATSCTSETGRTVAAARATVELPATGVATTGTAVATAAAAAALLASRVRSPLSAVRPQAPGAPQFVNTVVSGDGDCVPVMAVARSPEPGEKAPLVSEAAKKGWSTVAAGSSETEKTSVETEPPLSTAAAMTESVAVTAGAAIRRVRAASAFRVAVAVAVAAPPLASARLSNVRWASWVTVGELVATRNSPQAVPVLLPPEEEEEEEREQPKAPPPAEEVPANAVAAAAKLASDASDAYANGDPRAPSTLTVAASSSAKEPVTEKLVPKSAIVASDRSRKEATVIVPETERCSLPATVLCAETAAAAAAATGVRSGQ
jgi:hypothetical protein